MYGNASARIFAFNSAAVPVSDIGRRREEETLTILHDRVQQESGGRSGPPLQLRLTLTADLLNRNTLGRIVGFLGQVQFEDAVHVLRLRGRLVDVMPEHESAIDLAEVAFGA